MEEQKLVEKIWGKVQKIDGLKKDIADLKEETSGVGPISFSKKNFQDPMSLKQE